MLAKCLRNLVIDNNVSSGKFNKFPGRIALDMNERANIHD
jgi:hypothetical protein